MPVSPEMTTNVLGAQKPTSAIHMTFLSEVASRRLSFGSVWLQYVFELFVTT